MNARNVSFSFGSAMVKAAAACLIGMLLAVTFLFIAMASGVATFMFVIGGYALAFLIGFFSMMAVMYLNSPDAGYSLMQRMLWGIAGLLILALSATAGLAGHVYACSRFMHIGNPWLVASLAIFLLAFLAGTRTSFFRIRSLFQDES
jgi:hypothetical protein